MHAFGFKLKSILGKMDVSHACCAFPLRTAIMVEWHLDVVVAAPR